MRLCHRKWLRLFSLKFQRNNQKSALAIGFAKGKTEKKAVFSPHCGMKQPHTMTEPFITLQTTFFARACSHKRRINIFLQMVILILSDAAFFFNPL